ncbi:MAG: hypothetical protein DRP76_02415 [Candidatus Omnitrophota bacterium]|nr:MAG: hypothetical protein DRP76_02415 [Candidatus Omnitrophota bacterium]
MQPAKEKILEELIDEFLKKNEEEILAQILNLIYGEVVSLAYSFTHNQEDAKDIFQEVSFKIYKGLRFFRKKAKASTWIYRITVNTAIDCLRRRKNSQELKENCLRSEDMRDKIEKEEKEKILRKAIDKLSPKQKKVFILRHYHYLKIHQISQILNCSPSSVKTHLFRAIENLRRWVRCV